MQLYDNLVIGCSAENSEVAALVRPQGIGVISDIDDTVKAWPVVKPTVSFLVNFGLLEFFGMQVAQNKKL